jgi:hypothetical protein
MTSYLSYVIRVKLSTYFSHLYIDVHTLFTLQIYVSTGEDLFSKEVQCSK